MLDDRFLDTADALPPRYKHAGLFLSRLQLQLDPELAMVPLDGRPPPHVYARRSLGNTVRLTAVTAAKFARKARQRLNGRIVLRLVAPSSQPKWLNIGGRIPTSCQP